LVQTQPVPGTTPKLLYPLYSAYTSRQLGAKQPRVGRFVCQPPNRSKLLVDGVGSQPPFFKMNAVTDYHDAIESQAGF
jgi:hypothetical protein